MRYYYAEIADLPAGWEERIREIDSQPYQCGHCGAVTVTRFAFVSGDGNCTSSYICLCALCSAPTWFHTDEWDRLVQLPAPAAGRRLNNRVPHNVLATYDEARDAHTVGAYTAVATLCRKLLMNVAVSHGAPEGKSFAAYVDWLAANHYTPPKSAQWVDAIRQQGNVANHEVRLFTEQEATQLLAATYALLFFVYEMADEDA